MEGTVYILCTLTALACAIMLLRSYGRSGTRLLLWCGVFFLALTVENSLLFVDMVLVPETDLSHYRRAAPLIGLMVLLYGLIWEVK